MGICWTHSLTPSGIGRECVLVKDLNKFFNIHDSICLLLKASEYGAADDLAEKWLGCEENFLEQKYFEITELYTKHVLLPQGLHQNIEQFLETNKALSSEQKQVREIVSLL